MKIVCISGKAQHGKDTTAGYFKEYFEAHGKKVLIAHYGDLLKYICRAFFDWDGVKDERGRTLLQFVGTNQIRLKHDDNYWVKFICDILSFFPDQWDYVLIPDCRFPNEIEYVRERFDDVVHVRVHRENPEWTSPLTGEQQKHPSETALDGYLCDITIFNKWDLDRLRSTVNFMAEQMTNEDVVFVNR